jgi:hypothetical protein
VWAGTHDAAGVYLFDIASGRIQPMPGGRNMVVDDMVWMPDGTGVIVNYRDRETGYRRRQIGFQSRSGAAFRPITRDTSYYHTLTVSPDGRTLATVQEKQQRIPYLLPPVGFPPAASPEPAFAPDRDLVGFAWIGGDLLLNDSTKLIRAAPDGSDRRVVLEDPGPYMYSPVSCAGGRYIVLSWGGHVEGQNV